MKSFKEYLTKSQKQYPFRIKIAHEMTSEQEDLTKSLLGRFIRDNSSLSLKKSKTPIQAAPFEKHPRL